MDYYWIIYVIVFVLCAIFVYYRLKILGIIEKRHLEKVKKMQDSLSEHDKTLYKKEKRKTFVQSVILSIIISIIWIDILSPLIRGFDTFDNVDLFLLFIVHLGVFCMAMIITYMYIDEKRQKKWIKKT
jgi:hypothetical protein